MLFISISDHSPWLKNSKKENYFLNATHGSNVRWLERSMVTIQIVQGKKIKLSDFPENGGILFVFL